MKIEIMQCKIHRAVVTDANLNYEGSIAIDKTLCEAAGLVKNQKVDIYNCNTGGRFSTYIIYAEKGVVSLNGAAARMVCKDDQVIIVSYARMDIHKAKMHQPTVLMVNKKNEIVKIKS